MSEMPYGYWDLYDFQLIDSYTDNYEDIYGGELNSFTDSTGRNPIIVSSAIASLKPIIYGVPGSIALDNDATITINNQYKLFLSGSENKEFSLEFFFNINDSLESEINLLSIGTFLKCYVKSDRIYIKVGNQVASVLSETWDQTNYVCIFYKRGAVSIRLNNKEIKSIVLSDEYRFPDSTAPTIVFGPAASNNIPIYINSIALYSYVLSEIQMNNRILWSKYNGNADRIATAYNAEVINPKHLTELESYSTFISTKENLEAGELNNVLIDNNSLTLAKLSPVSVVSKQSSAPYSLTINGISFSGQSFIQLSDATSVLNPQESVIRGSLLLDGLASDQTVFEIGPGVDFLTLSLVKTSDNTIALVKTDLLGTKNTIIESGDLGSVYTDYLNFAVTLFFGEIKLILNDILIDTENISMLSSNFDWYLGNSFSGDSPLTSRIKDFTVDNYDNSSDEFIYSEIGLYTLRFLNGLSVSQRGEWSFIYPRIENSISTQISYNYGSKNSYLFVGGEQVFDTEHIPNYNYANPSNIEITSVLKTEDSSNDLPVFDDLSIISYDSLDIPSSGGRYSLKTLDNDGSEYAVTQGYLLNDRELSPLDRPKNLGIKLTRLRGYIPDIEDDPDGALPLDSDINVSTGSRIVKSSDESSDNIEIIEMVISATDLPSASQTYTIVDATDSSSRKLTLTGAGLVKTGSFNLYVDGQLVTSFANIIKNEFYYVVVELNTPATTDIYLGINKSRQDLFNGTIGNIVIHNEKPIVVQDYIDYRFNAMVGRNTISVSDSDSIEINDSFSGSRSYLTTEDGRLFSMNELPKVKIVQDRWESFV